MSRVQLREMNGQEEREAVLRGMQQELERETAPDPAPDPDPVEQILERVTIIMDRAHKVALDQCAKANSAVLAAAGEAQRTIELLRETIEVKRSGTADQVRHYMASVRHAQISAEDIGRSTVAAIAEVRESIGRVSEQVLLLPAPVPAANGGAPAGAADGRDD